MFQGTKTNSREAQRFFLSDEQPEGAGAMMRSDDEIRSEILRSLELDSWVNEQDISVQVSDGVVTLEGQVDVMNEKRAAGDDAWETPGVKDVDNNLRVSKMERLSRARRAMPGRGQKAPQGTPGAGQR